MSNFDTPDSSDPGRASNDSADELLDRLLEEACWPEPAADAVERLVVQWDSYVAETVPLPVRSSGNWLRWSAAAAVLLAVGGLAVGGLAWWGLGHRGEQPMATHRPKNIKPLERQPAVVERTVPSQPQEASEGLADRPDDSERSWRPPNAYEQVLVFAQRPTRNVASTASGSKSEVVAPSPRKVVRSKSKTEQDSAARLSQWVADALVQLRDTPDANVETLLEGIAARERGRVEVLLARQVAESTGAEQLAALRLLTPLATSRSLPALRKAAATEATRDAALPAWLRLEDSARLAQSTLAEPKLERRRRIFASLWDRDDQATWELMFQFVNDSPVRDDASAALGNADQPPIDWLCEVMTQSPRAADRTTAAELLGRLDNPQVTARLIELTGNAVSRQAALAGLLASSEPSARKFLESAEQNPYLVASIWNARSQQAKP